MCEFIGWHALLSAEWIDAIGSVVGGLGALAAAWTSVMIARSIRRTDNKRRAAEAIALLRLITPEMALLPIKFQRYLIDIEETRDWWGDSKKRVSAPPQLLRNALDRLSEDLIPHTTASVGRLSVLDDMNYASIANDCAGMVANVSLIREQAMYAKFELENHADRLLDVTLKKLTDNIFLYRTLAAILENKMQPTIDMDEIDYVEMFGRRSKQANE